MSETKGRERGHQGASRRPNPCGGGSTLPGPMSRRTGPLSWQTVHRDQARDDLPPLGGRRAFSRDILEYTFFRDRGAYFRLNRSFSYSSSFSR